MMPEDASNAAKQSDDAHDEGYDVSFGIGCLHFASTQAIQMEMPEGYYEAVEELLRSAPHITNIIIERTDSWRMINSEEPPDDLGSAIGIWPWPVRGEVSFEIQIPKRFHDAYTLGTREISGEHFLVRMRYTDELPVTFIYTLDSLEPSPSSAVVVVRKHLDATLGAGGPVRLQTLGPSPFHADFYVRKIPDRTTMSFDYARRRGYDDIYLEAPADSFDGVFSPDLERRIAADVGFFYHSVQKRNSINCSMAELLASVDELTTRGNTGFWGTLKRRLLPASHANDLRILTEKVEIDAVEFERDWLGHQEETIATIGESIIEEKMKQEIRDVKSFPLNSYRNIASAIDARLTANSSNRLLIISAIVSGIVSVFVTLAISAFDSNPAPTPAASQIPALEDSPTPVSE